MTDYSNINFDNLTSQSAEQMVKLAHVDMATKLFGEDAGRSLWLHLGSPKFEAAKKSEA